MGSLAAVNDHELTLNYPSARRDDSVIDNYHGVLVSDPYRWLEDRDSEETKTFVEEQVKLTESVLKKCETRDKLCEKLTNLNDFPKYDAPFRAGADDDQCYFYFHNTGLQPQKVLYVQHNKLNNGEAEILLDPNRLSDDGTVALGACVVSQDAKYLAYGVTHSGSDWVTIKTMRIQDKVVEPDTISWVKFSSIAWTHDSKGFFYSRYPAPEAREKLDAGTETDANLHHQLYYHFIGMDQSEDILCWNDPENPKHTRSASITEDGKYVILYTCENCSPSNSLYYCDLTALPEGLEGYRGKSDLLPFVKLVDSFEACYDVVANDDTIFTFRTNKDASRYKLIRVDLNDPSTWSDVVPENEKDVLQYAVAANGNQLVISYQRDVKHILQLRDLKTGAFLHQLPLGIGTVCQLSAKRKYRNCFVGFTSFLDPGIIYECDLSNEVPDMKIFREITVPGFDRTEFVVNQVFVQSKDKTKIPMFIMSKKDTILDGSHPCLLYGYGGFNTSLMPYFAASRIVLAKHLGVVICVANIRGGGEYGEEWHKAGALDKKQNCFDDFISASEYLVSAGYTKPSKLCIEGASNGGLLVGACINQRPDLFGCALAHVGVMDMLRFHKFTIGHAWTSDFGCSENEEEFHWLIKYSPLHNVRRPWEHCSPKQMVHFPPTMLLTADHDDRVVPLHSLKMLATLQFILCTSSEIGLQTNPIVACIESKAGHGCCGKPMKKQIDEAADRYAFMAKMLGASWVN